MQDIARALDEAGVDAIEVAHGDGLQGSSFNYGFGAHTDLGVDRGGGRRASSRRKITTLLLPGIGTVHDLKAAYDAGVRSVRVATHCTEADVSKQHIEYARELGMDTVGFLMMSHMITGRAARPRRRKLMESYGAQCVYVTDSGGAHEHGRTSASACRPSRRCSSRRPQSGMHAHHNLSLGVANSIAAVEEGATASTPAWPAWAPAPATRRWRCSSPPPSAWAGTTAPTCIALMDAADDLVRPLQDRPVRVDRETLGLGYAGVYSSFLRHAEEAAGEVRAGDPRHPRRTGQRRMVGGQEDMIVDVALDLLAAGKGC